MYSGIKWQDKRAHANDLKLAQIDDWELTEPRNKKERMRKATFMEREKMETDEDFEKEEERNNSLVEMEKKENH